MSEDISQLTKEWANKSGLPCWYESETTSTSDIAKSEAYQVDDLEKVYIAGHQSAGRGRGEHHWLNGNPGTCLLITWRFSLSFSPQHLSGPLFGLALFRAVQTTWPNLEWGIKPPNDLYLKDKKLAGLLLETLAQGSKYVLLAGLGMNIQDHPEQVDEATHLTSPLGLGNSLEKDKWEQFLSCLHSEFKKAANSSAEDHLSPQEQEELLTAVNSFPLKEERYLEVTGSGDLVTESSTTSWKDL